MSVIKISVHPLQTHPPVVVLSGVNWRDKMSQLKRRICEGRGKERAQKPRHRLCDGDEDNTTQHNNNSRRSTTAQLQPMMIKRQWCWNWCDHSEVIKYAEGNWSWSHDFHVVQQIYGPRCVVKICLRCRHSLVFCRSLHTVSVSTSAGWWWYCTACCRSVLLLLRHHLEHKFSWSNIQYRQ